MQVKPSGHASETVIVTSVEAPESNDTVSVTDTEVVTSKTLLDVRVSWSPDSVTQSGWPLIAKVLAPQYVTPSIGP